MILDDVKLALRISHNKLDDEILSTIESCRLEMIRAGVSEEVARGDSPLVNTAIKTYCRMINGNDKTAEQFKVSFDYQLECIRKSTNV